METPAVPDYCEPIIGYRLWRVNLTRLVSAGGIWKPYRAIEAQHLPFSETTMLPCQPPCSEHQPYYNPGCGIYAFKTKQLLHEALTFSDPVHSYVIGAVSLWGRMVEHEDGYRAQFAYPSHFYYAYLSSADFEGGEVLAALAAAYGVPYTLEDSWKSESRFDDLWPNLYIHPSLSIRSSLQFQAPNYQSFQSRYLSAPLTGLPQWWTSPNILPPSALSLVRQPRGRIHTAPSFTIHKPTEWYFDKQLGLWMRHWPEKKEEQPSFTAGSVLRLGFTGGLP